MLRIPGIRVLRSLMGVLCLAVCLCASMAQGQPAGNGFPSRPIRIVVPFGAGSGTDIATRLIGQHLETALKQGVVTENRSGANGSIAASAVARATPDGYTLLMGTNSTHGANSGLMAKLPYDPVADFVPVGLVGIFSGLLVVNPALPIRTPAELVAYAKAHPKALSFAAGNTSSLIMGEMFARSTGIEQFWAVGALCADAAAAFGPSARHFDSSASVVAALAQAPVCASVLVKGSRFMRMEAVVAALQGAAGAASAGGGGDAA